MTPPIVGIHLDLKYLMPRKAFLTDWVTRLPGMGINTLLLEYEDKFPFTKYPFLRAKNAFSPDELRAFLRVARQAGLRIIPLIQSLSHLEFALCHEELAHLREAPHIHTQLDTSSPHAAEFIENLIDEVLAYHHEDEFFHLGGDEAWHLGSNPRTKADVERIGTVGVWAKHMLPFTKKIVGALKRPVLWEDVIDANPSILAEVGFPRQTVFMPWHYDVADAKAAAQRLGRTTTILNAGYDLIAAPCLNWGVLTPRHEHCLRNTAEMVRYARDHSFLGVINTAWACFHVLPHAQSLYIAATAVAGESPDLILDSSWREQWLADYFGIRIECLDAALEIFGQLTEFSVEGARRPVTLIGYGYMDYLLELGSIERRRAVGVYPAELAKIDQSRLFAKKLQCLRSSAHLHVALIRIDTLIGHYEANAPTLMRLWDCATQNVEEAQFLALGAELKLTHARVIHRLLLGEPVGNDAIMKWDELGRRLRPAITPFLESDEVDVAMKMWWGCVRDNMISPSLEHSS